MRNPWIGLSSYDEKMISKGYKFCGRSNATMELYSLVDNNINVTLYGKSGTGKSSFWKRNQSKRIPYYVGPCITKIIKCRYRKRHGNMCPWTVVYTIRNCDEFRNNGCNTEFKRNEIFEGLP